MLLEFFIDFSVILKCLCICTLIMKAKKSIIVNLKIQYKNENVTIKLKYAKGTIVKLYPSNNIHLI